jgi:hypothetical protein
MKNFALLKPESPFHPLFPGGMVPIQNILLPQMGVMEGDNGNQPQEFYRVDLAKLPPAQRAELYGMIARQCHGTIDEVRRDLEAQGFIPLRAVHVLSVSSDSLAFL